MVQRPGGDSASAKGWWTHSCMPCSPLWAGRTQTIRWVGQMEIAFLSSSQSPGPQDRTQGRGSSLEWHKWEQVAIT